MNSNSLSIDNLKLEPILIKLLQSKSEEKNVRFIKLILDYKILWGV